MDAELVSARGGAVVVVMVDGGERTDWQGRAGSAHDSLAQVQRNLKGVPRQFRWDTDDGLAVRRQFQKVVDA